MYEMLNNLLQNNIYNKLESQLPIFSSAKGYSNNKAHFYSHYTQNIGAC